MVKREKGKLPMIICDPCFVENDAKTHKKAVRFTFRLVDTGAAAPGPIKDKEIDLCPQCIEKMKGLLETLPTVLRASK